MVTTESEIRDLLTAAHRRQFARAAKFDRWHFGLQLTVMVTSFSAFGVQGLRTLGLLSIASLLAVVAAFWVSFKERGARITAENARRATLLVDGLGLRLSNNQIRQILAAVGASGEELDRWKDPAYYAATEAPSVERAAAMLEESAFWSAHLYWASAVWARNVLTAFLLVTLACFLLALDLLPTAQVPIYVRLLSTLASSFVCIDLLDRWNDYHEAAAAINEVSHHIERLKLLEHSRDEFLVALCEYNSAVERAPLIAPGVYARNKDRLNEIWRGRHKPDINGKSIPIQ